MEALSSQISSGSFLPLQVSLDPLQNILQQMLHLLQEHDQLLKEQKNSINELQSKLTEKADISVIKDIENKVNDVESKVDSIPPQEAISAKMDTFSDDLQKMQAQIQNNKEVPETTNQIQDVDDRTKQLEEQLQALKKQLEESNAKHVENLQNIQETIAHKNESLATAQSNSDQNNQVETQNRAPIQTSQKSSSIPSEILQTDNNSNGHHNDTSNDQNEIKDDQIPDIECDSPIVDRPLETNVRQPLPPLKLNTPHRLPQDNQQQQTRDDDDNDNEDHQPAGGESSLIELSEDPSGAPQIPSGEVVKPHEPTRSGGASPRRSNSRNEEKPTIEQLSGESRELDERITQQLINQTQINDDIHNQIEELNEKLNNFVDKDTIQQLFDAFKKSLVEIRESLAERGALPSFQDLEELQIQIDSLRTRSPGFSDHSGEAAITRKTMVCLSCGQPYKYTTGSITDPGTAEALGQAPVSFASQKQMVYGSDKELYYGSPTPERGNSPYVSSRTLPSAQIASARTLPRI